jgi:predicted N-acetyltransferase YhbS
MQQVTVCEMPLDRFEQVNLMCLPAGAEAAEASSAVRESTEALRQASPSGLRIFGAFLDGEPVGRLELSPLDVAPVPLKGRGVWVIRCVWVLDKGRGLGLGRRLMELAIDSVGHQPISVLTYEGWMPPAFFRKFGFEEAERHGEAVLMARPAEPGAVSDSGVSTVSFAPVRPVFELSPGCVRVDAVYTPRCPWRILLARRRLEAARQLSDRVLTFEHIIRTREDALRLGEEYVYIDGEPLFGGPVTRETFLQAVKERLSAKGLIY